jgi:hypothetical protein
MERNEGEPEPSYYAVIPSEILDDERLSGNAKLLYAKISALTKKTGFCWASNAYLARQRRTDERTVRRWLAELRDAGHIATELNDDGNARKIWLRANLSGGPGENVRGGPGENVRPPSRQDAGGNSKSEKGKKKNPLKSPKGDEGLLFPIWKKRLGAIFNRRASTVWTPKELKAFGAVVPVDDNDLAMVERYYRAERAKPDEKNYSRRDLITLLNNWPGEVDRARVYCARKDSARRRGQQDAAPPKEGPATDADFKRAGDVAKAELERFRLRMKPGVAPENGA